ncbi:hypothetical protein EAG14_10355 [Acidovorax sp. 1608163]|uniref:HAD domain-containing protein n=1 Tax=Acidovorax sp. 1608163 TaxID=2478662 RepID=UPI000EF6E4D9|nr:HAD domain-containing protein [Acidovorax sp. 1608163]AYM96405.1 hypothetical protein EAG14_10355 [Acidovorax sp. 1608163]
MAILFLDFDGVLHPEHCHESKHFSCLPVLEDALREAPQWQVVITSTWRLQKPLAQLRSRFSADIAARVVGDTPRFSTLIDVPSTLVSYEREAECQAWLRANEMAYRPWLAVDDRSWLFRPFCKSLFLVSGKTGLTALAGEQLKERMRQLL